TIATQLDDAMTEITRLEGALSATETERTALRIEATEGRTRIAELTEQVDATQGMLDALAAHAEQLELELSRAQAAIPTKDARLEAEQIVGAARAEADALRRQAMQEAEGIRRDALTTAEGIRQLAHEDARELRARAHDVALSDTQRTELVA